MKSRCLNKKNGDYIHYGDRGIKVCKEWINDFSKFLYDMGAAPCNSTIERIDNNTGYSKNNCKWIDKKKQNCNKRNSIKIFFNGKEMCLKEWAKEFNIDYYKLHYRYKKLNMTFEHAINDLL